MHQEVLQQQMQRLSTTQQSLSPMELKYCQFYGLDFEHQLDSVVHHFGFVDSCNYRIACHLYQQKQSSKGTWYILHGYFDHVGMMTHIIRFFLQQGYDVLAYDLPGHGLSTGRPATIPDFSIYSLVLDDLHNYCQTLLSNPCHAFGQSTGCAIITDFLNEKTHHNKPLPFEQVVLSAPLVRPCLWKSGRIQLYLIRLFVKHIPRKFTNNSRDQDFLKKAHNDPLTARTLPTQWVSALDRWIRRIESSKVQIPRNPLIIQGTQDSTVDASHNIAQLQKLYDQPDTLWLENARHHLPNELKETREQYFNWLEGHLTSL